MAGQRQTRKTLVKTMERLMLMRVFTAVGPRQAVTGLIQSTVRPLGIHLQLPARRKFLQNPTAEGRHPRSITSHSQD